MCRSTTVKSRHSGNEWYWTAPSDWLLSVVEFERSFSPVEALITNVSSFVYKAFFEVLDDVLLLRDRHKSQLRIPGSYTRHFFRNFHVMFGVGFRP